MNNTCSKRKKEKFFMLRSGIELAGNLKLRQDIEQVAPRVKLFAPESGANDSKLKLLVALLEHLREEEYHVVRW